MITCLCDVENTLELSELTAFQGDLKKRTKRDIAALTRSLVEDGMVMPFVVWQSAAGNMLLDGHGRLEALTGLSEADPSILSQKFPVIYINAESEEKAREALLQITSAYGKVTRDGAVKFCASIPHYHAPSINKYVHRTRERSTAEKPKTEAVIRVRVPADKEQEVRRLLKQVSYITVLE